MTFRFPDLEGKSLLITGITRGIGKAILGRLLDQGLRVVAVSRGLEKMQSIRAELGVDESRLHLFDCDLSDPAAVDETARAILAAGVPVDAILHNAAIDPRAAFEKSGSAQWQQVFQVNVFSAVALTRHLLPSLRRSRAGRILFTGSVMDELGGSYLTAYVSSKAALTGATRSLAHELKGTGITVNAIIPGAIQVEKEPATEKSDRLVRSWQSVDRRLVPADMLGLICLLLSEAGSAITAQAITVDGGLLHPVADPASQQGLLAD